MNRNRSVRGQGALMGQRYRALWNEVVWLYGKWQEFETLYANSADRIEILRRADRFLRATAGHDVGRHAALPGANHGSAEKCWEKLSARVCHGSGQLFASICTQPGCSRWQGNITPCRVAASSLNEGLTRRAARRRDERTTLPVLCATTHRLC